MILFLSFMNLPYKNQINPFQLFRNLKWGLKYRQSLNRNSKYHFSISKFIDGGDFEESKYVPTNQKTSLETRK
jgi:hypothetical protein